MLSLKTKMKSMTTFAWCKQGVTYIPCVIISIYTMFLFTNSKTPHKYFKIKSMWFLSVFPANLFIQIWNKSMGQFYPSGLKRESAMSWSYIYIDWCSVLSTPNWFSLKCEYFQTALFCQQCVNEYAVCRPIRPNTTVGKRWRNKRQLISSSFLVENVVENECCC